MRFSMPPFSSLEEKLAKVVGQRVELCGLLTTEKMKDLHQIAFAVLSPIWDIKVPAGVRLWRVIPQGERFLVEFKDQNPDPKNAKYLLIFSKYYLFYEAPDTRGILQSENPDVPFIFDGEVRKHTGGVIFGGMGMMRR